MKNNNKCATATESKLWKFLSAFAKPVYEQFTYVFLFLCMIDFWSVYAFAVKCIDSPEKISSIFSLQNFYVSVAILFLFAYLGALVMNAIRNATLRHLVKSLLYGSLLMLFVLRFFLRHYFNLDINTSFFVLLAGASKTEAMEFVSQYVFSIATLLMLLVAAIYAVFIIILEYCWKRKKHHCMKKISFRAKNVISALLFILFVSGLYSTNIYWRIYSARSFDDLKTLKAPTDPISSIFNSMVRLRITKNCVRGAIDLNKDVYEKENAYLLQEDSLNVVVVIGESYIKWHSQLYGYNLETTPNLYREMCDGRLFVFNDVISSSNSTSSVMCNLLCCNNSSAKEKWYEHPSFLTVFKKTGYNVYFWDNQCKSSMLSNYSYVLNSFLYAPELHNVFFTETNSESFAYDADIVDSFNETCNLTGQNNLILFHLLGQHITPSKRFPHDTFKHFTAESITRDDAYLTEKMKEYIADYDNATLYNDYVVNKIFDKFKDSNTILLYFSDHGEEAYDYRGHCGRDHGDLTPMVLKYQYEVPFFIWCSETYKKNNPDVVENIRKAVNRPFVLDNVCNTLFNVGGILTSYYRANLDLISPYYQCHQRLLKGVFVYEDIRYAN